ncbi:glycosyltransferase [Apibacter muscae]|uniref:Glycosyltransferase n=1 Tax=Apibacter muscae TaxID=2509004 RepID=A0A563DIA1_9FLAO|nr:glycosyltransferase family 4 protein [Apibacter muscae]TWP29880.1 glycosyltransferase [Apibacter muscae]
MFSNFFSFNVKQGNVIEKRAADNSTTIIVSSDWAKNPFINDYKIPEKKIKVIEFGANIDNIIVNPKFNYQKTGQINLLFLGVDWERKGGEIAIECLNYLNDNNIKSVLHVVGTKPPIKYNNYNIKSYGYLNKNLDKDYSLLKEIIYNSDLLLLPTKAECSAIVFSEASAYGLPILTYDTGGVSNYVINGQNGYRLNLKCGGKEFAEKILEIIHLKELDKLREGFFAIYKQKLNWECWKAKFMNVINEIKEKLIHKF